MKKDPKAKALFSSQMSHEDREKFKEIAEHRGQSMAGVLRTWIRSAHKKVAQDA